MWYRSISETSVRVGFLFVFQLARHGGVGVPLLVSCRKGLPFTCVENE